MSNAVFASLIENLREINIITEPTPAPFTKDRIQTGNGREFTIRQFVERYFPLTYSTKKGPIYSMDGVSQEMDCVLLAPNHPQLITPLREVILAEGVHAAIELKPDISNLSDDSEFVRALGQIKSVKRLSRDIAFLDPLHLLGVQKRSDYFKKIPTYLFAFKSKPVNEVIPFLLSKLRQGEYELYDLPDFIITLDNGIIFFTPFASLSIFADLIKHATKTYPEQLFIHFRTETEMTLAIFLLSLFGVQPPEPLMSKNILLQYLTAEQMKFDYTVRPISLTATAEMVVNPIQNNA